MEKTESNIDKLLSIIVLNYNRLECTKQTISNLIEKTTVHHEFIFVDNGSIDGTREYLLDIMYKTNAFDVRCLFNSSNYGVAGGRNEGLRVARGGYLMTIDDDIIVPEGYDKQLTEACDKVKKLGITGVNVEGKQYKAQEVDGVKLQIKRDNLGGGCLCMPRRVFDMVGYFRADFVYGCEDCDMYNRIAHLKLINAYVETPGKHIGNDDNDEYKKLKKSVHRKGSKPYNMMAGNARRYKKGKLDVYAPYKKPHIETEKFDEAIKK